MTLRVLHLVGSATSEFFCDLSRLYGRDCLDSTADPARYEFHIAYVTPDRYWRFPADLTPEAIASAPPMPLADAVRTIATLGVEVMVPQMFCAPGMTSYRALFDVLGIAYVGNTPEAMALSTHKARAKAAVAAAGVAVPRGESLRPGDSPSIPPPAVVKPVDADNSSGVSLVHQHSDYDAALQAALACSKQALTEEFIDLGREVRCAVLAHDGRLVCLPLEEYAVDSADKPVRGPDDKLRRDEDGDLGLVAKHSSRAWIVDTADPVTEKVWNAARRCHAALGCRDYSLFDFRIDPGGRPWFLEAGLYCSFARSSVVATMAEAAGIDLDELFRTSIDAALER